jgi:ABC-2 type transport system permease protein
MKKFWTIFKHEYVRHVMRKRFLIALLSVPLWFGVMAIMGIASVLLTVNRSPAGYVDQSGLLHNADALPRDQTNPISIDFLPYLTEADAQAALDAGQIQAYFVLPQNYPERLNARLIYNESPDDLVISQFRTLLRSALVQDQPPNVARRVIQGPEILIQATEDDRQMAENEWFRIAAPFVAAIFLMISVFTSAGYLLQAVVEEKENRTMEILATSVSPGQIMIGKIAALISVGWTQVLIWLSFPLIVILLIQANTQFLDNIAVDWGMIGLIIVTAVPTFILISALMATIGATVTEAREGQQVMTLVTLPVMSPFMLFSAILANPGGIISMVLSFFPLTAALTLLLRVGFSTVPLWQIAVSVTILVFSAAGSLWLAGRVFRLGMLRYGRRMGWKEVFRAALPTGSVQAPVRKEAR